MEQFSPGSRRYVPAHPLGEGKRKLWRFLEHELLEWVEARETEKKRPPASTMKTAKREANNRVMEMVFEAGRKALSAPSPAPSKGAEGKTKKGTDRSSTLVSTLKGGS